MPNAIGPAGENLPPAAPANGAMRRAIATHFRRNRNLYLSFGIGLVVVVAETVFWVRYPSSLFAHAPTGAAAPDRVEAMYDWEIRQNLRDFNRWYKANIVIQVLTIAVGIFSTVFASLATQEDAVLRRRAVVVLTAITAALVTIQSTFHIKDNLDTFIKANSDLEVSRLIYVQTRDGAKTPADKAAVEALKLEAETLKSLVLVNEARMRAYSGIGAPQARGASEAVIRPPRTPPDETPSAAPAAIPSPAAQAAPSAASATVEPALPPRPAPATVPPASPGRPAPRSTPPPRTPQ